jgi:hypothetical protein
VEILKNNEMNFSTALGSEADLRNKGRFNYLSFTRSKMSGFKRGNVKIVFDGNKLNQKYKSIPIDYWEYSKNEKDWSDKNTYIQSLKSLEQEDRIISNDTEIPNIAKYIKEIHIWDFWNNSTAVAVYYARQRNIPFYVYDNEKDFLRQTNPIKNLDYLENPTFDSDNESDERDRFEYDLASFIAYNSQENYNQIINYIKNDEKIQKFIKILEENIRRYYNYNAIYFDDGFIKVKNAIHHMRMRMSKSDKFLMSLLMRDMKKNKTKNLKEYLFAKQFYGKKTRKQIKNELINYLYNVIDNYLPEEYEYRLKEWIEVDGEYYNYAYQSPQLIKFINRYVLSLKNLIKNEIEKSDNLVYIYALNGDEIIDYLKIDNIKHDLNITDKNDYLDINRKIYDILYGLTILVSSEVREKSHSLEKEYREQLN